MRISILIGGKAGQGPNSLTHLLAEALAKKGYYVFYSRDYQSLIRGGHNFNVLTFSDEKVFSNDRKIDILIALDENTERLHKKELKKKGAIVTGEYENMYFAGRLFRILGLDFEILEKELKKLKNFEENLKNAKLGFKEEARKIEIIKAKGERKELMNGSQGIAFGAIASGLDVYYAYPMTPATPILFELAPLQEKNNFLVLELENEIACINAAIGSSITGAKSMVGTSGGGFDLMTEALSETGQAEIPLVVYLASRPGPSTGVATYTGQGDLKLALYSGHGEFNRVVIAPGNPEECQEKISEAFYFSQKFKIPAIVLSDKHLGESFFTLERKPEITNSKKSAELKRYNSYEHTETGEATENPEIIKKNAEGRMKKKKEIGKEAEKFRMFNVYGNEKSKNVILSWGSTKGAILDVLPENCKFIQILYLIPFPDLKKEIEGKNLIVVENNITSPLSDLIAEKFLIKIKDENKILKFDGRPFLADELKEEIIRRLK